MITGDFVNGLHLMVGLSTDTKPETTSENTFFLEEDTGDVYYFSEGEWAEADAAVAGIVAALLNKGALPAVTSADNGKVLGVENGAWGKMDAPSGLPDVASADNEKILIVENGKWVVATADNAIDVNSYKPIANSVVYAELTRLAGEVDDIRPRMRACDSTAQFALAQMIGASVQLLTPVDIDTATKLFAYTSASYLLWQNGTKLDSGKMLIEMDLANHAITLYAKGKSSMVSGVMGVDTSWTVTSL